MQSMRNSVELIIQEENMKIVDIVAAILLIIGGLNWGLVGLFRFDLVQFIVGGTGIDRLVYILVGLSALWLIIVFKAMKIRWGVK